VLFQYHPHAPYERRLLHQDVEDHPEVAKSYHSETRTTLSAPARERVDDAWRLADRILCASSFTRDTLVEAGADSEKCRVIPYGIPQRDQDLSSPLPDTFEALFVGSGVQRKGLHHLLHAWKQASLPSGSRLTLVCRVIDPGIASLVETTKDVRLYRGVSQRRLHDLYRSSTLFAMPSLIEGFGQVYLEALSFGCPVLGTPNTCLPDLGDATDGVYLVPPRDIDALSETLSRLSSDLPGSTDIRTRAADRAAHFTWPRFRRALRRSLPSTSSP
jgi:glycosyltransferase involved in cell wall biosynthesis